MEGTVALDGALQSLVSLNLLYHVSQSFALFSGLLSKAQIPHANFTSVKNRLVVRCHSSLFTLPQEKFVDDRSFIYLYLVFLTVIFIVSVPFIY